MSEHPMNKEQRDSNTKGVSQPTFFGDSVSSANHWRLPLRLIAMAGTAFLFFITVHVIVTRDSTPAPDRALSEAVRSGNIQAAREALASGALVNRRQDITGSTLLHSAAWRGDVPMARLLVEHGAIVNIADKRSGETPLHSAARGNEPAMVSFLLSQGAGPEIKTHAPNEQCSGITYPAGVTAREIARISGYREVLLTFPDFSQ